MTRRLIAALAELRAKLALVEALIESGETKRALEMLEQAEADWKAAIEELRS